MHAFSSLISYRVTFMEGKRGCMQAIPRALWPSLTFADVAPRMRHSGFKFFEVEMSEFAPVLRIIVFLDSLYVQRSYCLYSSPLSSLSNRTSR